METKETQVWSLGQEDSLEKGMATHTSILAWKIPWTEEPDKLLSMGSQSVRQDWATSLHLWIWEINPSRELKFNWMSLYSDPCPRALLKTTELSAFPSVQFSHSVMSDSLRPHESQHARSPCSSQTPGVYSDSCPSNQWCHPAISSSVVPFSSFPQSLSASHFSSESTLRIRWPNIDVSASASVLPINTQDWSPLRWTPCSPRDFQQSFPTPQFKSINSLALSFLYSPTLTSIHDYWINHRLDYMDLRWQSNVYAF